MKGAPVEAEMARSFPEVPLDEFVCFLDACRSLLSPNDLALVEEVFRDEAASIDSWIDSADAISEETALGRITELLGRCHSLPEAVVRVRATQTAFFWRRYLLKVNLDRLLAAYAIEEEGCLDAATIASLSSYAAARYPAAAAVALGGRLSPVEIASLNMGDVELRADRITIGRNCELPPEAWILVLPHFVERLLAGASSSDPLFIFHTSDKSRRNDRVSDRAVGKMFAKILQELGIRITHASSSSYKRSRDWRWRRGISIQPLRASSEAA
jgi:integrase